MLLSITLLAPGLGITRGKGCDFEKVEGVARQSAMGPHQNINSYCDLETWAHPKAK